MNNQITSGVKITVDTSDLDVKFTKSVEQLNAELTKTQRALNLRELPKTSQFSPPNVRGIFLRSQRDFKLKFAGIPLEN